ncbi:MAG: hypothetical protein DRH12_12655 [Deltaproteobacteria bacterium]|nr:MAG: hypothetical protein DRH12_12655 [Deltaproteobacteria bacterium]
MKKKIWVSALGEHKDAVQDLMGRMKRYGLEVDGHFWEDDLEKMAWMKARDSVIDENVGLWAILGSQKDLESASIRYGLSALAITVQAKRGLGFPILILTTLGKVENTSLPTPLKGADVLPFGDPGLGAKIVAKVHAPSKEILPGYRLDVYGNTQIGQWFEVGPETDKWEGAMLGINDGEITFQAVGPKGRLPSTSVLNYPMKGLKLAMGDNEYVAWAVKNPIDTNTSYFVKVQGHPSTIIFGPFSDSDDTDVFVFQLK